jgi:hypothetical protein
VAANEKIPTNQRSHCTAAIIIIAHFQNTVANCRPRGRGRDGSRRGTKNYGPVGGAAATITAGRKMKK